MSVPKYSELFNPTLTAIKQLGGSVTVAELNQQVAKLLQLSDEYVATTCAWNKHEASVPGGMGAILPEGLWTASQLRSGVWSVTRDGASPIDLVDGEELMDKLRELRLGVDVKLIEEVSVSNEWFDAL